MVVVPTRNENASKPLIVQICLLTSRLLSLFIPIKSLRELSTISLCTIAES
ncbi:hypothetical protein Sjap_009051 [Stephania japonica]|uniref:Uncharacterized protein n=1 Tax=Stephania japonica TaxID=461633 RepID=A0AAP0PBY1_9MAGN